MLKKFAHYLIFVAGAHLGPATATTAFQTRCEEQLPKIAVDLQIHMPEYTIDQTVSSNVLNTMSHGAVAGDRTLGMTAIQSIIEFGFDGPSLQDLHSNLECIAPRIKVALRYNPIKVYIAREFVRGTCPFREVLAHELRHVNAYRQHLPKVQELVRSALEKRFDQGLLYAPAGQAFSDLKREVDGEWVPFIKAELRKVEAFHQSIDTSEETYRMSNACQGEVGAILGNRY